MASTRRILLYLILAGFLACLVSSCGDEGTTEPTCVNCDFWSKPFDRVARFPAVSPQDPNLIAFVSTWVDSSVECRDVDLNHVWVARLPELTGEDTRFYQITYACSEYDDFEPAWSPDGNTIAFERTFESGLSDIYVVDVTDLESPGLPVQFTDRTALPQSNSSPAWVVIGGQTYIAFSNSKVGGTDFDVGMYRFPDRGSVIWLSIDPYDVARYENLVLSAVFKDEQVCGNGTNLVAFSSPDRVRVCDIKVIARSRETYPDSTARAAIYINGKASGDSTPYTFRYRPSTDIQVIVEGGLGGYCANAMDTLFTQPDTLNTVLLDFEYKHGVVGFTSDPGVKDVFLDNNQIEGMRTPGFPGQYVYLPCVLPGPHTAYAASTLNGVRCSPIVEFTVTAGETTLVFLDCRTPGAAAVASLPAPRAAEVAGQERSGHRAAGSVTLTDGVWLLDLNDQAAADDDQLYQVMSTSLPVCQTALSPDGRYVAYLVGEGRERRIVVSDLSGLLAGGAAGEPVVIGMPGSLDETECWRLVERVEWFPSTTERKLAVSLSICRGGAVDEDFEVWVADLSRFLD